MSGKGKVGFVGLGNVGTPMSRNLLQAGFEVIGFDLVENAGFVDAGGRFADSLQALAAEVRVIVQSLPTGAAVASSIEAIEAAAEEGTVLIDISSYPLHEKFANAERLRNRGITLLDCEVSGLPHMVADRTAVVFQSGDAEVVERLAPVFSAMTEQSFYLGDFGAATKMKLFANAMVCVHNALSAEILNLARNSGVDPALLVDVLGKSAAASATFRAKAPIMLSREFEQGAGPFRHMFHYLERISDLADSVGAATPLIAATKRLYDAARDEGRHDQDIAAMIELLEQAGNGNNDNGG